MFRKILFTFLYLLFLLSSCSDDKKKSPIEQEIIEIQDNLKKEKKILFYGFDSDKYTIIKDTIKYGDTFGKLLINKNVSASIIHSLTENSKKIFSVSNLKVGKPYAFIFDKNNPEKLCHFIYEPSSSKYISFQLTDSLSVKEIQRKISYVDKIGQGSIQNNLIQDMTNSGIKFSVAHSFSKIFDYTIDFFQLQKDDEFKIIYQEKYVDDTIYVGLSKIKAAYFKHKNKSFYAFYFQKDSLTNKGDFYDENANTMKKMFLKAPLDIFRITSKFGTRRHPILHKTKTHFGTDYAAPKGTPIRSTANGVISKTGYTSGNGNFVKIKHNRTYETQYLHMSKILVKKGQYVAQGDIIGLVGSTGLATGPHVCYRFWKNGVQVDPLNEILPQADPIDIKLKAQYLTYIEPLKKQLDSISIIKN